MHTLETRECIDYDDHPFEIEFGKKAKCKRKLADVVTATATLPSLDAGNSSPLPIARTTLIVEN